MCVFLVIVNGTIDNRRDLNHLRILQVTYGPWNGGSDTIHLIIRIVTNNLFFFFLSG